MKSQNNFGFLWNFTLVFCGILLWFFAQGRFRHFFSLHVLHHVSDVTDIHLLSYFRCHPPTLMAFLSVGFILSVFEIDL